MNFKINAGIFAIEQDVVGFKMGMPLIILTLILIDIFAYLHFNRSGNIQWFVYAIILIIETIIITAYIRGELYKKKRQKEEEKRQKEENYQNEYMVVVEPFDGGQRKIIKRRDIKPFWEIKKPTETEMIAIRLIEEQETKREK